MATPIARVRRAAAITPAMCKWRKTRLDFIKIAGMDSRNVANMMTALISLTEGDTVSLWDFSGSRPLIPVSGQ